MNPAYEYRRGGTRSTRPGITQVQYHDVSDATLGRLASELQSLTAT